MAAPRRVKTPAAGPGYSPLPVKPIPETGSIVAVAVNSGAVSTHVLASDVSLVELIPDVDCYVAAGDTCSSADYPMKAGGYYPFGIPVAGTKLAFRSVTGAGSVKIVGA